MNSDFVLLEQYFKNTIVDTSTPNITYVCRAKPGSIDTDAVWQIYKEDKTVANIVEITWADGNALFDNKASDRLTLSYS